MNRAASKIRLLMLLRRQGITDVDVLRAVEAVPREIFVPTPFRDQAYENTALPIGHGQTISQPQVVGLMTQALAVGPNDKVLEIGTGSGYQAAILAKIAQRVYTVERHRPLMQEAEARFASLRLHNVTARLADGLRGWPEAAPFERILVTAGCIGYPPPDLVDQLAPGGIMVIPLGPDHRALKVVRFRRPLADGDGECGLQREELWPVRFVPLLPDLAPYPPQSGVG